MPAFTFQIFFLRFNFLDALGWDFFFFFFFFFGLGAKKHGLAFLFFTKICRFTNVENARLSGQGLSVEKNVLRL